VRRPETPGWTALVTTSNATVVAMETSEVRPVRGASSVHRRKTGTEDRKVRRGDREHHEGAQRPGEQLLAPVPAIRDGVRARLSGRTNPSGTRHSQSGTAEAFTGGGTTVRVGDVGEG
jgi:hypothetical protein